MKEMKIKEFIQLNIDSIQDEIDFKLMLFNEGNYDRNELRTVIRNTGIKLEIVNNSYEPIIISKIYFGLLKDKNLITLYSSSQMDEQLPTTLYSGGEISFFFYGWEVKEILQKEENEDGVFIFSTDEEKKYYRSSQFNGKNMEEKLIYLEDNEVANWGGKKYNPLDIEVHL